MKERKTKFTVNVVKWFDRVNGNTYHSCRITRCKDGKSLYCPFTYGYGEHYRQTTFAAMEKAGWIKSDGYEWERKNNYPILWNVTDGKKRDCVENGKE